MTADTQEPIAYRGVLNHCLDYDHPWSGPYAGPPRAEGMGAVGRYLSDAGFTESAFLELIHALAVERQVIALGAGAGN
jgi:hypothetical protein